MVSNIKVYPKISWEVDNTKTWQETFYPSEVERIIRSHDYYSSNFKVDFVELDKDAYLNIFLPLYTKEIASRPNYVLNLEEQKNLALKRIEEQSPQIMFGKVFEKSSDQFVGGLLFSLWDDRISVMHRVIDREINKKYRKITTLDYWFEAQFRDFTRSLSNPLLTHGHDRHPYIQRIGLAEFKMRIGSRPNISRKEYDLVEINSTEILKSNSALLYFTEPEDRKFKKATLLYTSVIDPSIIHSCKSVLEWSKITTECIILG